MMCLASMFKIKLSKLTRYIPTPHFKIFPNSTQISKNYLTKKETRFQLFQCKLKMPSTLALFPCKSIKINVH